MLKGRRFYALVAIALAAALVLPAVALAGSKTIYPSKGIGSARLGMGDKKAAKYIGKIVKSGKDNNYPGQTVYYFYFGKKSGGKYAIEMYSNKKHIVFGFVVNSSAYATAKGVKIGSTEAKLKSAYPSVTLVGGSTYTHYRLATNPCTDFYCKGGKVRIIQIWKH